MTAVHATVWDETGGTGVPVVFVHNIFTWGSDEEYGFARQRPLADRYRLLMMDRRGYGDSPDTDRADFAVDAEDVIDLLGTGGHLVGHGYGGVVAVLAASQHPELVRSLTLIQPSAFDAAREHPAVAAILRRVAQGAAAPADTLTPEEFLTASTRDIGLPTPPATPARLRAVATSMAERPVFEAQLELATLADAAWPTLVICGTWEDAPTLYREYVGEPLMAVAEAVAEAVGAQLLRVPGYYPHTQQPAAVNAALLRLWQVADGERR
ncbi:alpha/beta fold hydrolase [Kitasatospora kifunensis]|uniref:Pimeloyl-ACP methyl ester carboxylesterase n=1 Tax=Kitasatospora kifunensis TaxID=58351 RepID=A0A7W7QX09_KITKI|nr:alpha/beta hydrolase [Kitasatospora kifunensis]MBB4921307.1 pimeloyl-ACP methyl ester carboxylesterase [Kitasatospora kifunensis]